MVRIDFEVGLYTEDFKRILNYAATVFKDNEPKGEDKKLLTLLQAMYNDMVRYDKENPDDE